MESILNSIKKLIGISEDYSPFDADIIMHINSVLMDLNMLGVGPAHAMIIEDDTATWTDFIPNASDYAAVKSYMYLRVKLLFDSSTLSSAVIASMEKQIEKYEWMLNAAADTTGSVSSGGSNDSGDTNNSTGKDGFSPIVIITSIDGGHRVTITDSEGTKYFDVLDGPKGTPFTYDDFTPEQLEALKGKDYILTDADKTDIANTVVDLLPKYNGEVADV